MPRRLTPREALAMACHGHKPDVWAAQFESFRRVLKNDASRIEKRLRALGFTVVPIVSKKGRER